MRIASAWAAAAALLCGAAALGCAPSKAERGAVSSAVDRFFAAVREHDGARACALLVPRAAEGLVSGGSSCEEQVLELGLSGGTVGRVEIWGDQAQARSGNDTVFLVRWADGWRLTAAGCEPRPRRPYDCEIED